MKNKISHRRTCWVYVNLRNGAQLRAMKRNNTIEFWYYDDYGDHAGGRYHCSKNETVRKTLIKLASKMSYKDYFQFEWSLKRLVETSH